MVESSVEECEIQCGLKMCVCVCVCAWCGNVHIMMQVIHCVIIYDIIRKLVESFTERDVELLLLLLKSKPLPITAN